MRLALAAAKQSLAVPSVKYRFLLHMLSLSYIGSYVSLAIVCPSFGQVVLDVYFKLSSAFLASLLSLAFQLDPLVAIWAFTSGH
jgi:hypothetical protein